MLRELCTAARRQLACASPPEHGPFPMSTPVERQAALGEHRACCEWVAKTERMPRGSRCGTLDAVADGAAWLHAPLRNNTQRVLRIAMNHGSAGFFAYMLYALNQLVFCRRHGLIPFVDFGRCTVNGHDHYASGGQNLYHSPSHGRNMWEYYFEPVSTYREGAPGHEVHTLPSKMLWRLHRVSRKSIYAHYHGAYESKWSEGYDEAWYRRMRVLAHSVLADHVRVRRHILDIVDRFWSMHLHGRPVLGVHMRGTDKQADISGTVVPPEQYVRHIDGYLALHPNASIFVATDSPVFLERLRARYPDRLVARDALRSERNAFLDAAVPDAYRKGEDVLVDVLLLARCDFLLKCASAVGEFAIYFSPHLHDHSVDVQLQAIGPSARLHVATALRTRGRGHAPEIQPSNSSGWPRRGRGSRNGCSPHDIAGFVLINATDACSNFLRCPRSAHQRCRTRSGLVWHRNVQTIYGAFRESYSSLKLPRRARPAVSDALAAAVAPCTEKEDLVISRGCNDPVLSPLSALLPHSPAPRCVRVLVLDGCTGLRSNSATELPRVDARDELFDVRRIAVPPSADPLAAYASWATSAGMASTVTFLPVGWHRNLADWRACAAHLLFGVFAPSARPIALHLGDAKVVRLVQASISAETRLDTLALSPRAPSCGSEKPEPAKTPLLGMVAMLLSAVARAKVAARLTPPVTLVTPQAASKEPPLPLDCLEPDFMQHNRALLVTAVSGLRSQCGQKSTRDAHRIKELIALASGTVDHSDRSTQCQSQGLLRTKLLPAGWFSMLHGLVKPFSHALRSANTLLTPELRDFTAAPVCDNGRRDLGCFFRPRSPACDTSPAAASARLLDLQDPDFVRSESPEHANVLASGFEAQGWFWWSSQLLRELLSPAPSLAQAVTVALQETGLGPALLDGPVLGLHVRHGDACLQGERVRMARTCSPLAEYMQHARPLTRALGIRTIYLATDSEKVLEDTRDFPNFRFLHLANVSRFGLTTPSPTRLWDETVKRRAKRASLVQRNHREAWMATIDALLLSRCNAFVGKFTSTLFRTSYMLHAATCDCAAPFVSLDAPWCFDYGMRRGGNWNFPLVSQDGATVLDNRFWC